MSGNCALVCTVLCVSLGHAGGRPTCKAREVNWLMWIVSGAFLVYFAIDPIRNLIGGG